MVPGDDLAVDQADDHVGQDDEGEEFARGGAGQALGLDQEGQAPQEQEHHRGELGGEVHPEAEAGARFAPGGGDLPADVGRAAVRERLRLVPVRVVLQEQQEQDEDYDACQRAAREGGRPADAVQQAGDDQGGDEVSGHAREAGELGDHRAAAGREPAGAEPQDADERHRVAAAEEGAGGEGGAVGRGEREAQLACREQQDADRQDLLGAEAVHEEADGYLHARVDQQLEDRERRQGRGVDVESLGGVEAGDTEGRTEDDGDEVDGDADAPHGDGAAAAGRITGQGEGGSGTRTAAAHRTSPRARWENQSTC